jgi:hypothetical protein
MLDKLKNLMDLNKNGKVELWEIAIFAVGFIVAGIFLSSFG